MSHIFKSGKYEGKSIAQVALMDYLHLANLVDFDNLNYELKDEIKKYTNKLNNFIPKKGCIACGKDPAYFPLKLVSGIIYNPYKGEDENKTLEVLTSSSDLRCAEHIKTSKPLIYGASFHPIKFDILKGYSRETKKVIKSINDILLEIAGFSGAKTLKNCEEFFQNLKIKGDDKKGFYQPGLF